MVLDLDDEEYFPRGGSSGRIKTKKNFVFESKKQNKEPKKRLGRRERIKLKQGKPLPSNNEDDDEENEEEPSNFGRDILDLSVAEPRLKKVDPLSYQALAAGMVTMCSVNTILGKSLKLSLPERLLCTVASNKISTPLTGGSNGNSGQMKPGTLNKIFGVGDFLACKILTVKRRSGNYEVTATTDPADINGDLNFSDIHVGTVLFGAINSVEDHGYMVFSGISGLNVFLSFENCFSHPKSKKSMKTFVVGELVWCKVLKSTLGDSVNNVQVSVDPKDFKAHSMVEDISSKALLPGMELDLTVTKHLGRDLEVSAKGIDGHGFVPRSHFPSISDGVDQFKIGSKLKGVVLYRYPISNVAAYSLKVSSTSRTHNILETGEIIERAEIVCHDKRGLGVKWIRAGKVCYGVISRRRMQGNIHSKMLEQSFPKGNHLTVVVIGYHHIDQLYSCSTENEMLSGKFLTMSLLKDMIGKAVTVVVREKKERGAVVMVDNRTAFVPDNQITDTMGANSLSKLQINSKQKGRILRVDPDKNSIIVTLRPTLVNNKPLTDFSKISPGEAYYGTVLVIKNQSISVGFFNGLKAEIAQENLIQECQKYKPGSLVKCYVVKESRNSRPPIFSLVRYVDQMVLSIGLTYKLIVKETNKQGIVCLLEEKGNLINVPIPLQLLADDASLQEKLLATLTPGTTIDGHLFCFDSQLNPVFTLRNSVKYFFEKGWDKLLDDGFTALKPRSIIPVILVYEIEEGFYVSVPIPKYNGKVLVPKEDIRQYGNVSLGDVLWMSVKSLILSDKKIVLEVPTMELNAKQLKNWAVMSLRSHLTTLSQLQTLKLCEKVTAVGTGKRNQCQLQDGRKCIVAQNPNDAPVIFPKGQPFELTVIHEDPDAGTVHLVEASSELSARTSVTKKFRTVFISEKFFVGKAENGTICFCSRYLLPYSTKPDLSDQKISREKPLTVEICYIEGELCIGHVHVNLLNNSNCDAENGMDNVTVQPRESAKKRRKINKSLKNKPNLKKKAKLTVVTPSSPDRIAIDSDVPRREKKKRKKNLKAKSSSESNPLLDDLEYEDASFNSKKLKLSN